MLALRFAPFSRSNFTQSFFFRLAASMRTFKPVTPVEIVAQRAGADRFAERGVFGVIKDGVRVGAEIEKRARLIEVAAQPRRKRGSGCAFSAAAGGAGIFCEKQRAKDRVARRQCLAKSSARGGRPRQPAGSSRRTSSASSRSPVASAASASSLPPCTAAGSGCGQARSASIAAFFRSVMA